VATGGVPLFNATNIVAMQYLSTPPRAAPLPFIQPAPLFLFSLVFSSIFSLHILLPLFSSKQVSLLSLMMPPHTL
jgi:hypothetical protein